MAITTWNPADLSNVTLSGGNLIASTSVAGGVRSISSAASGKWYWETTVNAWGASGATGPGLSNSIATLANVGGVPTNAAVIYKTGAVWVNNANSGIGIGASVDGGLVCHAVDLGARLYWGRVGAAGNWNNNVANNPATGVGGVNIAAMASANLPTFGLAGFAAGSACQITANYGATAFTGTPPAGYTAGLGAGSPAVVNTIWNPVDKSGNVTLTGGNLIATAGSASQGGVRSVNGQGSGKYYWECTYNTITGTTTAAGITLGGTSFTNGPSLTGSCGLIRSGAVQIGPSTAAGVAFGTITSGTVVCVAYDVGAGLIWFRLGAGGNWNTPTTANPATGTGGIATTGIGAGATVFPTAWFLAASDQITGNFGDSAFTGAVPGGFTSGFNNGPVTAAASASQARAMVLA